MLPGFAYIDRIASIMDAEPTTVKKVLSMIYEQGALLHGVKSAHSADLVNIEGVKPLTPEGGDVSFWKKGVQAFINTLYEPSLQMYDSPLFDRSGIHCDESDGRKYVRSCLVITDYQNLKKYGVTISSDVASCDGEATISKIVPRNAIDVIDLTAEAPHLEDPRERGKFRERTLLGALYEALITFPEQGRGRLITRNENGIYVIKQLSHTVV